jgi:hypothetical protein
MNFNPLLRSRLGIFIGGLLITMLSASLTFAQSGTSGVSGTVSDSQGAAVAGATVTLSNADRGISRNVITNDAGFYNFPSILPATYTVEVEKSGFKKVVQSNVQALVDSPIQVDITLEVGGLNEVVNVTTSSIESIVNTQDASLGNNFVPQQITQLPTESRNINQLLSLQPGVTAEGYVNGGRADQANITLDGVDVNDQQSAGAFESVLRVTTESIEEFRVTTSNPNANQGRSSGAQVSLSTKSGTNDFRGAAFYFLRPNKFAANDFFSNRAGNPRPKLRRDLFGGAIGGPIVKDKFFFFYSYEGFRERTETSVINVVPLSSLGRGELRFVGRLDGEPESANRVITLNATQLNSIFPSAGLNQFALAVLADAARRYPANDFVSGVGDGLNTGGFRFNANTPLDQNTHILRLDYNINNNQSLFLRGNYQYDSQLFASQFPDTPSAELWTHPYGGVVGHNWTIGSNKVNNFRYGYTRQAFTAGGDSTQNAITFRFVYEPFAFSRSVSRVTPVHNFTDDFTWTLGNHTLQFGGNVRLIRNNRVDFSRSYDTAVVNPSFYASSGRVLSNPVSASQFTIASGQTSNVQNAVASLIGRFSQYTGTFNYDLDGNVLPTGTAAERSFATEEYDVYIQDSWKIRSNLTLTAGLRYGLSRPVYERNGYQVRPTVPLGDYFEQRAASAAAGRPYNESLNFELAGPKYDKPGFYSLDKDNFQPRIAAAWSPNFKNGFLNTLFGSEGKSTIRGGFAITNDYFGQQLAVTFDQLSTLGFATDDTIAANTFTVSGCTDNGQNPNTNPCGPRFTGFNQAVRNLPRISAPNRFQTPADEDQRIESSLDSTLVSPINYSWNVSYGRQLPKGLYVEASYVGRAARNLLATRDVLAQNNLVDTRSGMDWYTAAGMLADLRDRNVPLSQVQPIPYFENIFPSLGARFWGEPGLSATQSVYQIIARQDYLGQDFFNVLDWTFVQLLLDDESFLGTGSSATPVLGRNIFFQPQYATFSAFSTTAYSNYHGGSLSVRQRLGNSLTYDVNYTFAKSMDNASGLQTSGSFGAAFILNSLRPDDNYAVSDFDVRHVLNANVLWQIPIGRGRQFFSNSNSVVDALVGGWQLTSVFRYNSGLPVNTPFDAAQWATNWNVQSNGVRVRQIKAQIDRNNVNLFSNPQEAYTSFRNARAGETGDRNIFRDNGFSALDLGLSKSFTMPWSENHKLQFRWEVFNVANYQYFSADNVTRATLGLDIDSQIGQAAPEFGQIFSSIKGQPRRMQFGLRYSF